MVLLACQPTPISDSCCNIVLMRSEHDSRYTLGPRASVSDCARTTQEQLITLTPFRSHARRQCTVSDNCCHVVHRCTCAVSMTQFRYIRTDQVSVSALDAIAEASVIELSTHTLH